jgi:hypothetical protein
MQFGYERFQFIQREMLFQSLDTPERLVRKSDLLRKFDVGQLTPFFTHEDCQLLVEITSHCPKMANNPPRMCGDMKILQKKISARVKFRRSRGDEPIGYRQWLNRLMMLSAKRSGNRVEKPRRYRINGHGRVA